jgi:L-aminopeptidase/D-esterase-like protein
VELLASIHQYVGYGLVLLVLVIATMGFGRAKDAREFTPGPYVVASVLLDIQVLAGLILYGTGSYWDHPSALVRYVHPALAVLALVAAHAGLKRARRQRMAVDAHRGAARALLLALVLVVAAIGAVSVGLRA